MYIPIKDTVVIISIHTHVHVGREDLTYSSWCNWNPVEPLHLLSGPSFRH